MKKTKKIYKYTVLIILLAITIFIGICFWLYTGQISNSKTKIFNFLPFPMAFVNGQPIAMSNFTLRYNSSKKISSNKTLTEQQIKANIYKAIINETLTDQIANSEGLTASTQEINNEYNSKIGQTSLEGKNDFSELLNSYGLTDNIYKQSVIKPNLLYLKLHIWFYNNKTLNKDAYNLAEQILTQLNSGQDFNYLAKKYSQDEVEQSLNGDLGFLDISEILPEFRESISTIKEGEIEIIASRYGIHIIKLEEINENKVHLRQIFLKGNDFNSWYNSQTKKIKIIKLLNI